MPIPRIGLIGPDRTQPCGIADYTGRLADALALKSDLAFAPFRSALSDSRLDGRPILVQYERSLLSPPSLPGADRFLSALARRHPGRVFVVPHEVYDRDPFAFPYADLRSAFLPLLWMKRLRYRWSHRAYAAEKRLQARAYHAHRVIPLSAPGAEILLPLAGSKVLEPIPLAFFTPPIPAGASTRRESDPSDPPRREAFFPSPPRAVIGIFGFLNPGSDYASALDMLAGLDAGACLLLLGGPRREAGEAPGSSGLSAPRTRLAQAIAARGLQGRVHVTGFLPEASLDGHLRLCDAFLCPMRFKSNSSSLLNLIHLGKPILASDLPLTRYLKAQGAPLELYADAEGLRRAMAAALSGAAPAPPNRYPWDFGAVAEAYLRAVAAK
jgi:glycosyltransferase involved in cell wall biosynthesis